MAKNALFTNGGKVSDLITVIGDVHHIFPKKYLIRNGWTDKSKHNQIANYTYLDTQVNKAISDDAPSIYFRKVFEQCKTKQLIYGNIVDLDVLRKNLRENCIPEDIVEMEKSDYDAFLNERRKLMAQKIKVYYYSL